MRHLLATAALLLLIPGAGSAAASAYDLNDDSRQDLVLGLPWVADGESQSVGAVAVVEGSKSNLFGETSLLSRGSLGLRNPAADYAALGSGVASGDFDGDGTADLAVGAPGEGVTGAVAVAYGSTGFPGDRRATFTGPPPAAGQPSTSFGSALVAGDLNGDGFADLVVADPAADPRDADYGSGAVYVLYGSSRGLSEAGRRRLSRPDQAYSEFGSHLALGDTNADKLLDLFEGDEGQPEWVDDPPVPGHFSVGRNAGTGQTEIDEVRGEMEGGPTSIAIGDVNGDGYKDVVLGVPVNGYAGEDQKVPAGAVRIFLGGKKHLSGDPITIKQSSSGIPGSDEERDLFGYSVAVAKVDSDSYADIIVGAPGEDSSRGRITVIRGTSGTRGYAKDGHYAIDQDTKGIPGDRARSDRFGARISVLDLNGDDRRDLLVAASGEDGGAGVVTGIPGTKGGFASDQAKRFFVSSLGVELGFNPGSPEMQMGRAGSS